MLIYILLVAEILLLNYSRLRGHLSKQRMCWIVGITMIIITGLRSVDVGSDTTVYYLMFKQLNGISLSSVIALDKRDFGFYIFAWIINNITGSFTVLTLLTSIAFYIPITTLIIKYSDDPGLSYLIMMAFNFFQFSMTGIRQTIAIGMTVMFMLELLREKPRIWRCISWIALGSIFHISALLMVVFPLIKMIWNKKQTIYGILCLIPATFLFGNTILSSLNVFFERLGFELNTYSGSGGGITTFIVYLILLIWGVFFARIGTFSEEGRLPLPWVILFGIAVLLQPFVLLSSVLFRVVWYFSIYMTIYIPKLIKASAFTARSKQLVNAVVYVGVLYMYFFMTIGSATVLPYEFCFGGI